jgi:hypothetical protein
VSLVATVSPKRALELLPSVPRDMSDNVVRKALSDMMSHGRVDEAVEYLSAPNASIEYPFDVALQGIGRSNNDTTRVQIMRGAVAAMRRQMQSGSWQRRHQQCRQFPDD